MPAPLPPITLLTDFGESDHYVAQMKGVILGLVPSAVVIDVTHAVPPQDVRRAAFLVADLADAFPTGTVHVAVVDPGVGSDRAILAVDAGGQFYVAPDNGLLTLVFDRHPRAAVTAVTNPAVRRPVVSSTFHGRDVIAPAAARLLAGLPLDGLGPPLGRPPLRLEGLRCVVGDQSINGAVAWVDRFGNAVTNIPAKTLEAFPADRLRVRAGTHELVGLKRFYAEAPAGEPLPLIGSSGRLEVAVNGGSAAERLGLAAGSPIEVTRSESRGDARA